MVVRRTPAIGGLAGAGIAPERWVLEAVPVGADWRRRNAATNRAGKSLQRRSEHVCLPALTVKRAVWGRSGTGTSPETALRATITGAPQDPSRAHGRHIRTDSHKRMTGATDSTERVAGALSWSRVGVWERYSCALACPCLHMHGAGVDAARWSSGGEHERGVLPSRPPAGLPGADSNQAGGRPLSIERAMASKGPAGFAWSSGYLGAWLRPRMVLWSALAPTGYAACGSLAWRGSGARREGLRGVGATERPHGLQPAS